MWLSEKISRVKLWFLFGVVCAMWSLPGTVMAKHAAAWDAVLAPLNQPPEPKPSFYSVGIDENLLTVYELELGEIKKTEPAIAPDETKSGKRDKLNRHYYEKISQLNARTLEPLEKASGAPADYRAMAIQALAKAKKNPVASLEGTYRIPSGGEIGFCFGRALLVHDLLLKAGVPQRDIAKIFTIGQLVVEGQLWRFHVGVLVRDPKSGFIVVDVLQETPLPYREWLEINRNYDVKKPFSRARFYVTDPRKFLASYGKYDLKQLQDPVLKKYFSDLLPTL